MPLPLYLSPRLRTGRRFGLLGLLLVLAWLSVSLRAQVVTLDSAMSWIVDEHPLGRAAQAVEERGPAALQAALGGFDPELLGTYDRKEYLGSDYFDFGDVGVSWQSSLFGLKVESGYEWATGIFLNPERTVPAQGQAYIGIKLPLLQGMIRDKPL